MYLCCVVESYSVSVHKLFGEYSIHSHDMLLNPGEAKTCVISIVKNCEMFLQWLL